MGRTKRACHLHPILCTWDAVITCTPVTIFFPLGVWLCSKKFFFPSQNVPHRINFYWLKKKVLDDLIYNGSVDRMVTMSPHSLLITWRLSLRESEVTFDLFYHFLEEFVDPFWSCMVANASRVTHETTIVGYVCIRAAFSMFVWLDVWWYCRHLAIACLYCCSLPTVESFLREWSSVLGGYTKCWIA